jgi:hypothetical protein
MSIKRWRGLKDLVQSAVENGSIAVERIQKETARRPFTILESIVPIAVPARGIHEIYDHVVSAVHSSIRLTTRVVGQTADALLDVVDTENERREPGSEEPSPAVPHAQPAGANEGGEP